MNADKENMWRTLQGLKPIQPLRCRLGWHRWTSFEVRDGDFSRGYGPAAKCNCVDCGLPRIELPVSLLNKKQSP